jgi:hypothetical protein
MKKIVRLTESELTNIVKRVINEDKKKSFSRNMIKFIDKILGQVIPGLKPNDYDAEDYDEYKEEIVWTTLGCMAYEMDYDLPREKVEELFSLMETPEFNEKIKKGYSQYKKMKN